MFTDGMDTGHFHCVAAHAKDGTAQSVRLLDLDSDGLVESVQVF